MNHVTDLPTSFDLEGFRQRLHSVCVFHGATLRSADERLQAAMEDYRRSLHERLELVAVREAA